MAGQTGKTLKLTGWHIVNQPGRVYVQLRGWYLRVLTWQRITITEGYWIPLDPRYQRPPDQALVQEAMRRSTHTWRGKVG